MTLSLWKPYLSSFCGQGEARLSLVSQQSWSLLLTGLGFFFTPGTVQAVVSAPSLFLLHLYCRFYLAQETLGN